MVFEHLKRQVIDILMSKGLTQDDISKMLTDDDIYMGLNNGYSAQAIAEAILF